jgi:hypothetical protein
MRRAARLAVGAVLARAPGSGDDARVTSTSSAPAATDSAVVVAVPEAELTVFMTDLAGLEAFRQVRDEHMPAETPPASSLVQVSQLVNPAFRIEIEALAAT